MGWETELVNDSNRQTAVLIGSSSSSDLVFCLHCSDFLWSLAVLFLHYARFIPDAVLLDIKHGTDLNSVSIFLKYNPNFLYLGDAVIEIL